MKQVEATADYRDAFLGMTSKYVGRGKKNE